jgi:hypothetical protein
MKNKNIDYKWIDCESENKTTENLIYWIQGLAIIIAFVIIILLIVFF